MPTVINMKIFKTILECAYDLDILHFEEHMPIDGYRIDHESFKILSKTIKQGCYILTNCGDLEILVEHKEDEGVVSFSSKFKSNINSVENQSINSLIKSQLETEAFLGYDNYEEIVCLCESMS